MCKDTIGSIMQTSEKVLCRNFMLIRQEQSQSYVEIGSSKGVHVYIADTLPSVIPQINRVWAL